MFEDAKDRGFLDEIEDDFASESGAMSEDAGDGL
jgi:hypothetical protein